MSPNHQKFLSHLDSSRDAIHRVADWFIAKGMTVRIPGVRRAPDHDQWKDFADGGDLFIEQRIEVKKLSREFTCRRDWPFGEKFLVCAKHAWDRAQPKPYAIVILSSNMGHAAVVKAASRAFWMVEKRKDSRYDGVEQEFFLCPMEHVEFQVLAKPPAPAAPAG